jgi:hypothetical protein
MRSLVGLIAAAVMATMFVMPADARAKKPKRPAVVQTQQASPSLDGRTLGRMRTCGFDYLQYDGLGTPYGPTAIDARVTVGDATSRGSCDYRDCGICSRSVSFAQGPPQSGYHGRRRC